jgi:hypothetical protein
MRRIYGLLLVGMLAVLTLSGCSSTANTTTQQTSDLPTVTATTAEATPTVAAATATSSSNSGPTNTPTPASTTENCGSITATTTGSSTTTTPSDPQSFENCFTNAFTQCQSASLTVTFIDSTGKTVDNLQTSPQGGCEVASVVETKSPTGGSSASSTFTCAALVPYSQTKYSLRECTNNEWISLP